MKVEMSNNEVLNHNSRTLEISRVDIVSRQQLSEKDKIISINMMTRAPDMLLRNPRLGESGGGMKEDQVTSTASLEGIRSNEELEG